MIDDEKFFAWLDGELGPEEAARMAATVAANPELSRLADQHRAMNEMLRKTFDPIAASPVPEPLEAAVRPTAKVIDFAAAKRSRLLSVPQWTALAATLAIGLFVGTMFPHDGTAPVKVEGSRIYAAASLNRALDSQLASAPAQNVRIGLTYRNRSGEICRTFIDSSSSGLACRSGGRWLLRGLFSAPEGQSGDYRMAAGMDPNLAALVGSTMAGEPFDAAGEAAAKEKGWR